MVGAGSARGPDRDLPLPRDARDDDLARRVELGAPAPRGRNLEPAGPAQRAPRADPGRDLQAAVRDRGPRQLRALPGDRDARAPGLRRARVHLRPDSRRRRPRALRGGLAAAVRARVGEHAVAVPDGHADLAGGGTRRAHGARSPLARRRHRGVRTAPGLDRQLRHWGGVSDRDHVRARARPPPLGLRVDCRDPAGAVHRVVDRLPAVELSPPRHPGRTELPRDRARDDAERAVRPRRGDRIRRPGDARDVGSGAAGRGTRADRLARRRAADDAAPRRLPGGDPPLVLAVDRG